MEFIEPDLSKIIFDAALRVHKELGPGLLESAYTTCLHYELIQSGLTAQREVPLPLVYQDVQLEAGYRLDIVVENKVIIEVKSVDALAPIHFAQVLTYLKLYNTRLGMLINFNEVLLKNGFKRIVNG